MNLQEYISVKYKNKTDWFVEELNQHSNITKRNQTIDKREYLDGYHNILNSRSYMYKDKEYTPVRLVLQYGSMIIDYAASYLLSNPIIYTGNEDVLKAINNINRKGKYDRLTINLLKSLLQFGVVYEYVYLQDGLIKSKIIDADEGFPVFNHHNEQIGFIETWLDDGVSWYNTYSIDKVTQYSNEGGELRFISQFSNLSGLPIIYKTDNYQSKTNGKSILDDVISILDEMESLVSKFQDTVYKSMNPIPVLQGLDYKNKEEGLPVNIVGAGLKIEDTGSFYYANVQLDTVAFKEQYNTLLSALLNVAGIPSVALANANVSNLSSQSIRMMFSLADVQAGKNENYLRYGLEERLEKFRMLLELQGIVFNDEQFDSINMTFTYDTPNNELEIISNIKTMLEAGFYSLESAVEKNPYTKDVNIELERIRNRTDNDNRIDNAIVDDTQLEVLS